MNPNWIVAEMLMKQRQAEIESLAGEAWKWSKAEKGQSGRYFWKWNHWNRAVATTPCCVVECC